MLATLAAADSASTVKKKYSVSIYSEAEPHAMYAIYKQTHTLCVLQFSYFSKAALTTHKLRWLEHWGSLAELKLKWSTRELVYVGDINVTQST